jgi:hypothetical protein
MARYWRGECERGLFLEQVVGRKFEWRAGYSEAEFETEIVAENKIPPSK